MSDRDDDRGRDRVRDGGARGRAPYDVRARGGCDGRGCGHCRVRGRVNDHGRAYDRARVHPQGSSPSRMGRQSSSSLSLSGNVRARDYSRHFLRDHVPLQGGSVPRQNARSSFI